MSIAIHKDKCIGCKRCSIVCPGSLIVIDDDKKARIAYPRDCWGCVSCVKECPVSAIDFYLGADMGGRGSTMTVSSEESYLHWNIQKYDGTTQTITIDRRESNQY